MNLTITLERTLVSSKQAVRAMGRRDVGRAMTIPLVAVLRVSLQDGLLSVDRPLSTSTSLASTVHDTMSMPKGRSQHE